MNNTYDLNRCEVSGYPNYQVCELGRVYSTKSGREIKNRLQNGYIQCNLQKDDKQYKVSIHRILATIFIPNPNKYPCVDHFDRNKLNNSLENLRWCTHSMNMRNMSLYKNNTSSIKGVMLRKEIHNWYWRACIQDNFNKRTAKCFPYTEEGFEKAVEWRRAKEIEFNYTQV